MKARSLLESKAYFSVTSQSQGCHSNSTQIDPLCLLSRHKVEGNRFSWSSSNRRDMLFLLIITLTTTKIAIAYHSSSARKCSDALHMYYFIYSSQRSGRENRIFPILQRKVRFRGTAGLGNGRTDIGICLTNPQGQSLSHCTTVALFFMLCVPDSPSWVGEMP